MLVILGAMLASTTGQTTEATPLGGETPLGPALLQIHLPEPSQVLHGTFIELGTLEVLKEHMSAEPHEGVGPHQL